MAGGIPASQGAGVLGIFQDGTRGKWYDGSHQDLYYRIMSGTSKVTKKANKSDIDQASSHAWTTLSKLPDFGPGTVYTYNPLGYRQEKWVFLKPDQVTGDTDALGVAVAKPGVGTAMEQHIVNQDAATDTLTNEAAHGINLAILTVDRQTGHQLQPGDLADENRYTDPTPDIEAMGKQTSPDQTPARVALGMQVTGSHASMVLRVYNCDVTTVNPVSHAGNPARRSVAIQMLDAGAHMTPPGGREEIQRAAADFIAMAPLQGYMTAGHFAGEPGIDCVDSGGGSKTFVGLGTLPVIDIGGTRSKPCSRRPGRWA